MPQLVPGVGSLPNAASINKSATQAPRADTLPTPAMVAPPPAQPSPSQLPPAMNITPLQTKDFEMKEEPPVGSDASESSSRPPWMKPKFAGVKKVSNKERRRRQNQNLRRLLTPKNALMVLNEMLPSDQLTTQFKVEPANQNIGQFYSRIPSQNSYCANLTVDGTSYKGYGENKMSARNAAAEQAIRDLIIKKMNKVLIEGPASGIEPMLKDDAEGSDEESLPMIQLASYALHKLFAEWEYEGHKVPQLKPTSSSASVSEPDNEAMPAAPRPKPAARKPKEVPANAAVMHPCMLLSYMRPLLEYRELAIEGDRPQNVMFTMGVDVDGSTFIGKATNKKEARRLAARSACQSIFGVNFEDK